jgi:hypothetical protein
MKRLFTFLFSLFGGVSLLFSQVILTKATHELLPGATHECRAVEYQNPGSAGRDLVWDFSRAAYLDGTASVSSIEATESMGNIQTIRNDGCTFFFNITDKGNEYVGYQVGKTTFRLDKPIFKTQYPQSYLTHIEGNFEGTITTEGSYKSKIEGYYTTDADATGTIILPDGLSLPVLRIKTTEGNRFYETIKYLWYAQDIRYPVFVTAEEYLIASDGVKTLKSASSVINKAVKTVTDIQSPSDGITTPYKVFPNPFKDEIRLSYYLPEKTKVTVELLDSNGSKLIGLVDGQIQSGNVSVSKNVAKQTYTPGVYLLKIQLGNQVYTEKIVKAY